MDLLNSEPIDLPTDRHHVLKGYENASKKPEELKFGIFFHILPCPKLVHGQKTSKNSRNCVLWSVVPNTLEIFFIKSS